MALLLLSLGLLMTLGLAGCGKRQPEPPSQNLFYQVSRVSIQGQGVQPLTTTVSSEEFNVGIANQMLLDPSMEAYWSIQWHCMSSHCEFDQCIGTAHSRVRGVLDNRWLEVDRRIDWNDSCGQRTSWLSQVDQYSGQERYPSQDTLFQFWAGTKANQANQTIQLGDGREINAWCTGPQQAEMVAQDGWTTLYDGEVCYDVQTGMLVFMSYVKRWVFTGIFEGKIYERAYFGDSETYEQLLETTNARLSVVEAQ
jgi:hypothetical protein